MSLLLSKILTSSEDSKSANVTTDSDETRLFRRSSLRPNQRVASDIERESQK
eukprot:TCALIF_07814-PA protein Name:"Protein of unknown function" AED:0.46 eAED:0.68 QI:0/0/0/1/1/1/2/0/51